MLIARRFLEEFARAEGRAFRAITPEVEARLLAYPWPGNVRQLQNVIRNIVVLNDGPAITEAMLPALTDPTAPSAKVEPPRPVQGESPETPHGIVPLAEMERLYIERAIALNQGSIPLAAKALGISPSTIYRKKESWNT